MNIKKLFSQTLAIFLVFVTIPLPAMQPDPHGSQHIFDAITNNNLASVQHWIQQGADIESSGFAGYTPLMRAAIIKNATDIIQFLLSKGANIHAKNRSGETALSNAATYGNIDAVKLLLDSGANIEAATRSGYTALTLAIQYKKTDILRLLLDRGANVDDQALILAVTKGDLNNIQLLIDYGANPYLQDEVGLNAFDHARYNQNIIAILQQTKHLPPALEREQPYKSTSSHTIKRMKKIRKSTRYRKHDKGSLSETEEKEDEEKKEASYPTTPTEAHYYHQEYRPLIEQHTPDALNNLIVQQCLARERAAYQNGKYVLYRSEPSEFIVYEDAIKEIYSLVHLFNKRVPFVFTRFFIKGAREDTINEYVDHIGPLPERPPHEPNVLLSANIPLFGNIKIPLSCTWHYFLNNASTEKIDLQKLLTIMFDAYGFDKKYIKQLIEISNNIQELGSGSLQQIIIPKNLIDKVATLTTGGYCVPIDYMIDPTSWDQAKQRHTKLSPIIDLYFTNPEAIKDEWQVRILLNAIYGLNPESGIEFHTYSLIPENMLQKFKNQIKKIIDTMFMEWLEQELRKEEINPALAGEKLGELFSYLGKHHLPTNPIKAQHVIAKLLQEASVGAGAPQPDLAILPAKIATAKEAAGQARVRTVFAERYTPQQHTPASVWQQYLKTPDFNVSEKALQSSFIRDCARDSHLNDIIPQRYTNDNKARIVTYNVHKWEDPYGVRNYDAILATINNIDADVLILQEVILSDSFNLTADLKKMGYNPPVFMPMSDNDFGNIIASKYPFSQPPTTKIYNIDQNAGEQRNYINTVITLPDGNAISVYGTHLDVWDETGTKRVQEVQELIAAAQPDPRDPHQNIILAADWNAVREQDYRYTIAPQLTAWEIQTANFKARHPHLNTIPTDALTHIETSGFIDSFAQALTSTKNRGKLLTDLPLARLIASTHPTYTVWTGTVVDFIFCGPRWKLPIAGSYVYYTSASDHVPVIMDIELAPR